MRVTLRSGGRLVYVDDDDLEILIARKNLALSSLRRELLTFDSGSAFLEHMDLVKRGLQPMPTLVILDLRMPQLNGFDVLERVRADASFHALPTIVMFSNSDNPADIDRSTRLGADDFWVKPSSSDAYVELFDELAGTQSGPNDRERAS